MLRAIVSMRLIEKSDRSGMVAVCEILINTPKIAKLIESGETKDILEEVESSVAYYRMQSMNQSLLALLVNRKITYQRAMELSHGSRGPVSEAPQTFPADRGRRARRPYGVGQ